MVSLDGIRQFTLRELLALTDTYFHINGTVRFNKFDYVTVGLDNLKVSTVVDLDLSLYECGDSDLGIAYTREDISIYIHNADFQKVLDEYYATQF